MARPRVFVSSTYFDLKHIRASIEGFISDMGYDPVLFESGDVAFSPDATLDESCYAEVKNSHMLVLIIGGRYGSPAEGSVAPPREADQLQKMYHQYNSITQQEYLAARESEIPVFLFVDKQVRAEYETFKQNRVNHSVKYAHVDNVSVFHLLDDILEQKKGNYIRSFERFEDISFWLREQWAGIFAEMLSRKRGESALEDMAHNLRRLNELTTTLKDYSVSIAKKIVPDETEELAKKGQRRRQLYSRGGARGELIKVINSVTLNNRFLYSSDHLNKLITEADTVEEFVNSFKNLERRETIRGVPRLSELFADVKKNDSITTEEGGDDSSPSPSL